MSIVILPSGRKVRVPQGLNREERIKYLFENLPKGADKRALGDMLDSSGWGATVGGAIGGAIGGIAGLSGGGIGAIPLAVAGGAAGAGIGEGLEQLVYGKGDLADVGKEALIGGATGLIPGGAGQLARGSRAAKKVAGEAVTGGIKDVASDAVLGLSTGVPTPFLRKIGMATYEKAFGRAGQETLTETVNKSGSQWLTGASAEIRGALTGTQTTAAFSKGAALLSIQRKGLEKLFSFMFPKVKKAYIDNKEAERLVREAASKAKAKAKRKSKKKSKDAESETTVEKSIELTPAEIQEVVDLTNDMVETKIKGLIAAEVAAVGGGAAAAGGVSSINNTIGSDEAVGHNRGGLIMGRY